ncbi:MAG: dihydrofolate reductase [Pirellulaceae bacterium]
MKLSLIVAMSRNRVIGRDGHLPWRLSGDLRRFKQLTMGHPILMGRRTYESLGRPLPGRTSIVLTRNPLFRPTGVLVAGTIDDALRLASSSPEAFVIGGAEIYEAFLTRIQRMYVTVVDGEVPGDTYFPAVDLATWTLVAHEPHPADSRNELPYAFLTYDRVHGSTAQGTLP